MVQEKRKPFKGKKLHKDLRDYKNQEIKRSLVHRARLRKNYFKLLEKEGISPGPESGKSEEGLEHERKAEHRSGDENLGPEAQSGDESDENGGNSPENLQTDSSSTRKRHGAPLPPQKDLPKTMEVTPKRKPLNFAERAKLAKERKQLKRDQELQRVQEARAKIEQSQRLREKKKLSLQQRTKRGQPVMGPKINDLLDKIRQNS